MTDYMASPLIECTLLAGGSSGFGGLMASLRQPGGRSEASPASSSSGASESGGSASVSHRFRGWSGPFDKLRVSGMRSASSSALSSR